MPPAPDVVVMSGVNGPASWLSRIGDILRAFAEMA